jgi:hypothetical protein
VTLDNGSTSYGAQMLTVTAFPLRDSCADKGETKLIDEINARAGRKAVPDFSLWPAG